MAKSLLGAALLAATLGTVLTACKERSKPQVFECENQGRRAVVGMDRTWLSATFSKNGLAVMQVSRTATRIPDTAMGQYKAAATAFCETGAQVLTLSR